MVLSKRPADVIALGKRLVEELGLHLSVDTLGKWMSHHLAKLIVEAETETDPKASKASEARCVDFILHLWAKRDRLPSRARPIGRLQQAIDVLIELHPKPDDFPWQIQERAANRTSPWFRFAKDAGASNHRLFAIAVLAGVLEHEFGAEKRWLEENSSMLDDEERQALSNFNSWLSRSDDLFASRKATAVETMSIEDRESLVLAELDASIQRQQEAFTILKSQLAARRSPAKPESSPSS